MVDLPLYVWVLVLCGVIGLPVLTAVVLGGDRRVRGAVAAVWLAWVAVAGVLAGLGAFRPDAALAPVPWLGVAVAGAFVAALLAARLPALARALDGPATPARLAVPQVLRVVGGAFLIAYALDELPAVFAVPAGAGDVAVGVAAIFVARRLARDPDAATARWFNLLGLLDLVVALTLGFLTVGPARLLDVDPSGDAVTVLPLALIPLTAVPLAAALHVVSLASVRRVWTPLRRPSTITPLS